MNEQAKLISPTELATYEEYTYSCIRACINYYRKRSDGSWESTVNVTGSPEVMLDEFNNLKKGPVSNDKA